jgi:hypothetical protein
MIKIPQVFKEKDFKVDPSVKDDECMALRAQLALEKFVKEHGHVVYGQWSGVFRHFGQSCSDENDSDTTHVGVLLFVERIKDCEHEPEPASGIDGSYKRCKHCNVKLFEKRVWMPQR